MLLLFAYFAATVLRAGPPRNNTNIFRKVFLARLAVLLLCILKPFLPPTSVTPTPNSDGRKCTLLNWAIFVYVDHVLHQLVRHSYVLVLSVIICKVWPPFMELRRDVDDTSTYLVIVKGSISLQAMAKSQRSVYLARVLLVRFYSIWLPLGFSLAANYPDAER